MSEHDDEVISIPHSRLQSMIEVLAYATVEQFDACVPLLDQATVQDDAFSEFEVTFSIFIRELRDAKDELHRALRGQQAVMQELEAKLDTIERQQLAIRQLSTPLIEVWAGVICLPIVGPIDDVRGIEITEVLLDTVVRRRARLVIIDLTGIDVMSADTVKLFLGMGRAVRLIGAEFVLSGISPAIAQTLVDAGVDIGRVRTVRSLGDALACMRGDK